MEGVARELSDLHGTADAPGPGVLHIVHAARDPAGRLNALRIGAPATPASETDFFLLNASRAHADAVLTSAENLRREPALSHALQGPWAEALARYRREVLHKSAPLRCGILTRSGDLPDTHPVWRDGTQKYIFTPERAAAALRARFDARARIVALPDLDALRAAQWLHAEGAALVSIEAGPSTAGTLYAQGAVSELWLTCWQSARADAEFAGPLPADDVLFRGLARVGGGQREEHGQRFRFERWRRPSASSA